MATVMPNMAESTLLLSTLNLVTALKRDMLISYTMNVWVKPSHYICQFTIQDSAHFQLSSEQF
jgi:hypothetical protein